MDTYTKAEAIKALGGRPLDAARAVGCYPSAITEWPAAGPLPDRIRDRVQAALWRNLPPSLRARYGKIKGKGRP